MSAMACGIYWIQQSINFLEFMPIESTKKAGKMVFGTVTPLLAILAFLTLAKADLFPSTTLPSGTVVKGR